jgi:hypothetical protein
MIEEGTVIELIKHLKRQLCEEQARADHADREGRVKDFFWHAGYISAMKETLKEIERATGITGVYGKEETCRTHTRKQSL